MSHIYSPANVELRHGTSAVISVAGVISRMAGVARVSNESEHGACEGHGVAGLPGHVYVLAWVCLGRFKGDGDSRGGQNA